MTRCLSLAVAVAVTATAGCTTKDASAQQEPLMTLPALVAIDLSPGGEPWQGLAMTAPPGSKVQALTESSVVVLGPDGSGWGVELCARDAFDRIRTEHRGNAHFKAAVIDETDRYIASIGATHHVVVRARLGERAFTCTDYRLADSRILANSYLDACSALHGK